MRDERAGVPSGSQGLTRAANAKTKADPRSLVGARVGGAGLRVQVAFEKRDGARPGIQCGHSIFAEGLAFEECVGDVGIDSELEGLVESLHVWGGSGDSGGQSRVVVSGKREHRSLDLGHHSRVGRRTIKAHGRVYPRDFGGAFPGKAAAIAEASDAALAIGARQLERVVPGLPQEIDLFWYRARAECLGDIIGVLEGIEVAAIRS